MSDKDPDPFKRTKGDVAHAAAKAVLSVVPAVGGPAVELFQFIVQPPIEKRREEWMRQVGERLSELESRGLDLRSLQEDPQFISAVLQATQAALRTHNAAKLEALRNGLVNLASGKTPDETVLHLLLAFVDELTEMHLRILKVFQAPVSPTGMTMGGLIDVLCLAIPELRNQDDLVRLLWRDLYTRGLINTEQLNVTMSATGLKSKRTTALGDELLAFIEEPRS